MDLINFDKNFLTNCYCYVAGIDEAGRGPLAGPVACAFVVMPLGEEDIIQGVNDSKKISPKKRQELYGQIIQKALWYKVRFIGAQTIDKINILNATKLGMNHCYNEFKKAHPDMADNTIVLVDHVKLDIKNSQSITSGDAKSYNIACASILAKVERDILMQKYDEIFPEYGFGAHKGYGTKTHYAAIKSFGKTKIHRDWIR